MSDPTSIRITDWSNPVVAKLPKEVAQLLYNPIFTIQDTQSIVDDLTYRKINDWDTKDILSCSRDNKETGWRRFSIIDILKLMIISQLRKFGVATENIKIIMDRISSGFKVPAGYKTDKIAGVAMSILEKGFISCVGNERLFLLIDEDARAFFLPEKELGFYTASDDIPSSLLTLPFFSYVQKIIMALHKNAKTSDNPFIEKLAHEILSERERKILDIIRNKAYEELTIVRGNGSEMTVRAKSRERREFSDKDAIKAINDKDYQNITVAVVGGKKLSITREETLKV